MHALALRLLDVCALVECESDRLREALASLYRDALMPASRSVLLRLRASSSEGVCECDGDGVHRQLAPPGADDRLLEALVFSAMVRRVRSHWLIHAAALAGPRGGVLLIGESGAGKTTLALALAQRGYGWFSDEVAAVERGSAWLAPFPRGALVRPRTLELLPGLRPGARRWPLAGDEQAFCCHPAPAACRVPVRYAFVLGAPPAGAGPARLAVSRMTPGLARRLNGDPELAGLHVAGANGCAVLSWDGALSVAALRRCERACQEEGVLLLNAACAQEERRFAAPPRVEPLAASSVWLAVAGAAWNRPGAAPPGAGSPDLVVFLKELARALQHAVCYRLHPGPLVDTVALVDRICRGGSASVSA